MLYRQCSWLYLYRTIMPSKPSEALKNAVDEGLVFLRQLPTDSSSQSIVLMPLFILGCSAFEAEQRPETSQAFDTLQAYSNLGNVGYAKTIVERVWELIDASDESSWDWESIIKDMVSDVSLLLLAFS
jgi:Fungal specific transcription factor domain